MILTHVPNFFHRPQITRSEFKWPPVDQEPPSSPDRAELTHYHLDRGVGFLCGTALGALAGAATGSTLAGCIFGGLVGAVCGPSLGLSNYVFGQR